MKIRKSKKVFVLITGLVAVLAIGAGSYFYIGSQTKAPTAPDKVVKAPKIDVKKPEPAPADPSLTFALMGDMLAHDSVVNQAKTADGYDFKPYFSSVKSLYEGSDVVFCNPETPSAGASFGISGYPTFNAPTEFARDLSESGCNLINLASNHMADKGQAALNATLDEWAKYPTLAVTGANRNSEDQQKVQYFTKNNIKVAFLAFADFSNGPLPYDYSINIYHDEALVDKLVKEARSNADAVIVSMHWGDENTHTPNTDQRAMAEKLAGLNVDVIIGTGPHMIQSVEWLKRADGKQMLTWYSIGNMLSSQLKTDELTGGVAKFKLIKKDDKIEIKDIAFSPTFMSYRWSEADKQADRLDKRTDLKLQPLNQAEKETALFSVSVEERTAKVKTWLGSGTNIKVD